MGFVAPLAMAASAIGGAASAYGTYEAGQARGAAADYQSQVAENNAIIADRNADYATKVGEIDIARQGMKNRAVLGSIKAGQGASGVDVNTGSSADVQGAAAELGMLDALTIRSDSGRDLVSRHGLTAKDHVGNFWLWISFHFGSREAAECAQRSRRIHDPQQNITLETL